ncbi:unnamed protein product [Gongylonema pulchrum]|uniref:Hepatocyte growth factor-regulated tyrosine kinase substrate n=1 Tax=Gongylonema pulchrum TaxID=637853 RepID=A0A183EH78_9BILA|nr:unnamed protein product [Gongylonema pulchrum]
MVTMQQGGGQMMRAVMIQQGSPYDQANYIVPAGAGTTMQRTSDPYGIPQTQTGASSNYAQLQQGHMVARTQPMPYANAPNAPPPTPMQQSSTVSPQFDF